MQAATTPSETPLVIVSNRGPTIHSDRHGNTHISSGGGLVATLEPAIDDRNAMWLVSAVNGANSPSNPERAQQGNFSVEQICIDAPLYRQYYDVIANSTLWFLHHELLDQTRRPQFDRAWRKAWSAYLEVNERFADRVAERAPQNAIVLVHDYHLTTIGSALAERRPDLQTLHFHHTPFADPGTFAVLPDDVRQVLLKGLADHGTCGFHASEWERNFIDCCERDLGMTPKTMVSPASPDAVDLREVANSAACARKQEEIETLAANRKLIVRTDRMELSKNVLRGFAAYDDLLRTQPHWRERVTFAAYLYPSRQGLPEYLAYRNEVEALVERINREWSTDSWQPIVLHTDDDFVQSIAALTRYDVLLVNPVRDGLNLVAKEGPLVNERNGVLVLSRNAGSWREMSSEAIGVNPFDIIETSDAIARALEMSDDERTVHADGLRRVAGEGSPHQWLATLIEAAER